ncbi:sodium-dependent neutral amino acid transporter B(0)AT3 isoform X2 [Python bivittatus]|uniref:Transporter n=1 Tax=Python bivittatus TaxID=176946 RepID=A0A9F5MQP4_PYTBI|nr:sodium-dependent neutral amino acid transporter B(0)AT3 isoform X2 [Python bivittatus]
MSKVSLDGKITEDDKRPQWDNKIQYLLSCIGFAVGFGNVWRFPYLCQTYGGGAFLIPYVIALVFEGIPIFHLELAIGQLLRKGSIGVWNHISPYLGGIGYACMMVSFIISIYYNMILAWVLWYLGNSFQDPLPWSICPQDTSKPELIEECHKTSKSTYFWYRHTLNISTGITQTGPFLWWLVICLAFSWIIVYLCTIRGIESTGKLKILKNPRAWLDAATQIFFSLSLALGGHIAYSSYNPQKNDCEKDSIIIAAVNSLTSMYASISIFSILGFKATMNYRDCLDRNIAALTTAFNLTNQSISRENYTVWLESLSKISPPTVSNLKLKKCDLQHFLDQSASGPGLAFIVFTEVVLKMPGSQAWAILFFIMLFTLGLSSMFGLIQGILTPFTEFPIVSKYLRKEASCGIICFISFLTGLLFTTRSGSYWLEVFDSYGGSIPLLVISFLEVCGVVFVYGLKRFCNDVEWMTGRPVNFYWKASWQFISPVLMLSVFLSYLSIQHPSTYNTWNPSYEGFPSKEPKFYPRWVLFICGLLVLLPCIFIPIGAICQFKNVMLKRKEKQVLHPSESTEGS